MTLIVVALMLSGKFVWDWRRFLAIFVFNLIDYLISLELYLLRYGCNRNLDACWREMFALAH